VASIELQSQTSCFFEYNVAVPSTTDLQAPTLPIETQIQLSS
jgi:hypothetical protein